MFIHDKKIRWIDLAYETTTAHAKEYFHVAIKSSQTVLASIYQSMHEEEFWL